MASWAYLLTFGLRPCKMPQELRVDPARGTAKASAQAGVLPTTNMSMVG